MKFLDMNTWPRREHFEVYSGFDYPHFNITGEVDVSLFKHATQVKSLSLTLSITYVLAGAANSIPEFRYRIREERVVVHDVVHPSITILLDDETFSYCTIPYLDGFEDFISSGTQIVEEIKSNPILEDEPGQDDLLFMTSIPWVSFTGFMHPIHMSPADSVPRIAWGRIYELGQSSRMPLSVQGHHGLMDGLHVGRYFESVQAMLDDPMSIIR